MKIEIVLHGGLKNKKVVRDVADETLISTICFINEHGLFESDCWYPPYRIKEIRFDRAVSKRESRLLFEPSDIDDNVVDTTENN